VSKEEASQYGKHKDEDGVEIETEPEDSDFAEEHGESATCVVQRLLCNQKASTLHNVIKFSIQGVLSKTMLQSHHRQRKLREYCF